MKEGWGEGEGRREGGGEGGRERRGRKGEGKEEGGVVAWCRAVVAFVQCNIVCVRESMSWCVWSTSRSGVCDLLRCAILFV